LDQGAAGRTARDSEQAFLPVYNEPLIYYPIQALVKGLSVTN
jgi:hypothetical protein